MSTEKESIFCQEMDVFRDNLESKSGTFTSLYEFTSLIIMTSKLDKHAQHIFSVSGTRIKCITEHKSFHSVCLLADMKAETYSFHGGSSTISFLIWFRPTSGFIIAAKLDLINSISQNPHRWTFILGKLSVDPCFPLKEILEVG